MSDYDDDDEMAQAEVIRLVNEIGRILAGQPQNIACSALALLVAGTVINLASNVADRDTTADNMRDHVGALLADPELVAWIQGSTTPIHLGSQRRH